MSDGQRWGHGDTLTLWVNGEDGTLRASWGNGSVLAVVRDGGGGLGPHHKALILTVTHRGRLVHEAQHHDLGAVMSDSDTVAARLGASDGRG
jgi:hypothetical protein